MALLGHHSVSYFVMDRGRLVMDRSFVMHRGRLVSGNLNVTNLWLSHVWCLMLNLGRLVSGNFNVAYLWLLLVVLLLVLLLAVLLRHINVTGLFVPVLDTARFGSWHVTWLLDNVANLGLIHIMGASCIDRLLRIVRLVARGHVISVVASFVRIFSGHLSRSKSGANE